MAVVERLPGQTGQGREGRRYGLAFLRRPVHGRGRMTPPLTEAPVLNGLGHIGTGPDHTPAVVSPASSQKKHSAEVTYWATSVVPRLAAVAERRLQGQSREARQVFTTELAYAVQAVEAHPNNLLAQQDRLRELGVSDERVLDHVTGLMPVLQDERERIYGEANNRSY